VKDQPASWDSPDVHSAVSALPLASQSSDLDVEAVYLQTADFCWRTLQRMGVPSSDLEDVLQEVYIVVHRRLGSYDHKCRITTWLFGICLRVASRHRRRAWFRRERSSDPVPAIVDERTPEQAAARLQAARRLETILASLSPERRAVFMLFELEGQSCGEIAELMGVAVGTVYSRLHAARQQVGRSVAKLRSREPDGGGR
jgi:RNA polymerase sigma-70 factor (ECF subfamily)